jgi:hypothetical protein
MPVGVMHSMTTESEQENNRFIMFSKGKKPGEDRGQHSSTVISKM